MSLANRPDQDIGFIIPHKAKTVTIAGTCPLRGVDVLVKRDPFCLVGGFVSAVSGNRLAAGSVVMLLHAWALTYHHEPYEWLP